MVMTTCPGCREKIGEEDVICPKCGLKISGETEGWPEVFKQIWIPIVLLLIIAPFIYSRYFSPGPAAGKKNSDASISIPPAPTPSPEEKAMKATGFSYKWHKAGFGRVMMADFTITNNSSRQIKDFEITCDLFAPSMTRLGTNIKTLYDFVPPGEKVLFKNFNMGSIDPQVSNAHCACTWLKLGP